MTFRRALALCLMTASLASCNGSRRAALSAPSTVNLEGNVSGLVGFRLALQNGSTPLSIPLNGPDANGSQTFGTINPNTAYNITVKTQPTSPSQTCVVANGMGTTGATNVTNIAVTCTTNPPRFLYVANRGSGDVSGYTIDPCSRHIDADRRLAVRSRRQSGGHRGGSHRRLCLRRQSTEREYLGLHDQSYDRRPDALPARPIGTGSSPTSVAIDPSSSYVYVTGGGNSGTVSVYTITAGTGVLTAVTGSLTATGRLPSAVTVDPLGESLYVANQSDGTVSAFSISSSNGTLTSAAQFALPLRSEPESIGA